MSLLVMIPTRGRPEQCKNLIESFDKNTDNADLVFLTDADDESYKDFDWQGHACLVTDPRPTMVQKLNSAAYKFLDDYDVMAWYADDNEFVTPHWDTLMLNTLDEMGGSGWVYSWDHRRTDIPETWMVSTDIVREMGWYANPLMSMYFVADSIAIIAKRASLLRFCKEADIPHHHYEVDPNVKRDATYQSSEMLYGRNDQLTWQAWSQSNQVAALVSRLRRKFNPDVKWVVGKV